MLAYTPHRFNVTAYYRLAEIGMLAPDAQVELVDGLIFDCIHHSPFHAGVKRRLSHIFLDSPEETWIVSVSSPVRLDEYSEVQPDVMLIKYREDYYCSKHPEPEDVYVVIEIADESLDFDRGEKMLAYARSGIADFWIVNLNEATVEVYREPNFSGYGSKSVLREGDQVTLQVFPHIVVDVAELLKR